jgi:hypothetical protein
MTEAGQAEVFLPGSLSSRSQHAKQSKRDGSDHAYYAQTPVQPRHCRADFAVGAGVGSTLALLRIHSRLTHYSIGRSDKTRRNTAICPLQSNLREERWLALLSPLPSSPRTHAEAFADPERQTETADPRAFGICNPSVSLGRVISPSWKVHRPYLPAKLCRKRHRNGRACWQKL